MARKSLKAKEPVRLRFKQLANGNKSIYLDIYQNGKRQYDFLKLYIIPERTATDRTQNEQTLRAANAIKSQRVIELAKGTAGLTPQQGNKILLVEWLLNYPRTQAQQSNKLRLLDAATAKALELFAGKSTKLADADRDFCAGFAHFLTNTYKGRTGALTASSARAYYVRFVCALNVAVRNGIIAQNPNTQLCSSDKIKVPASQRCYLTKEELQRVIEAQPDYDQRYMAAAQATKQAFLFCCFCGLRISDVRRLTWANIAESKGKKRIEIRMQKTQEMLYVPISQQAQAYMPERGAAADGDKVFCNLANSYETISAHVRQLAAAAGINKHVTFHTARHTFATLLLTEGADLYTTSKLLGHADITTTQIYAKIVDAKKQEAVSLLDNIF
ncbi:MAG: site-specific integrase [Paludibacteraceae bacterium]|nr:site-specific integrase [Paludibacteraceae bacterium]